MDNGKKLNAIVTVVGNDRVGIIAKVCTMLAEKNVNVLDISQTILDGSFTMVMAVDITEMSVSFSEMSELLAELGKSMELSIHMQRREIFEAMHTI